MTAIRLECQPTSLRRTRVVLQGSKAKVLFQKRSVSDFIPHCVAATFVLRTNPGFTVQDIYTIIVTNNRHKYEIDEEGWNSRTWVYDQINLFCQHDIFTYHGEVELVNDALHKRWPGGRQNMLVEGAYYGWNEMNQTKVLLSFMLVLVVTWSLIKFATARTRLSLYCFLFHLAAQTMRVCYNIHIEEENA